MMYPAFEVLATLVAFTFVSITAYGALTRQRSLFTLGLCFFNVIPVAGELYGYSMDNETFHLALILTFLTQIIITLPIKANYGSDNVSAYALSKKIGIAILVTNLLHGCLILSKEIGVPHQFGYLHFAVALIMTWTIIKTYITPNVRWK
ncbi:hypothetical protein N9887_02750 [Flavobacteriaceae bacterium]|nr:hypothetical protein [Flavobacteriaceae bacterium]